MRSLEEIFPPFGLSVRCGPIVLSGMTQDDIPAVAALAIEGIYDDGRPMPFLGDWADKPADELPLNSARWYWSTWAGFTPASWRVHFVVRRDDEIVGTQDLSGNAFLVNRLCDTGSWLGRAHQGQGIGTLMRQAVCAFAFDEVGAREMRTAAFADNPRSQGVTRRVGYVEYDRYEAERPGGSHTEVRYKLTPDRFVRSEYPLQVTGADAFRAFIGL